MGKSAILGAFFAIIGLSSPVAAQRPDTLRLSLADVVRLAAERNASVELERLSAIEGEAAVTDERSELLPHLSVDVSHGDRTFNTASFGLDFPTQPGQSPLFDPAGEVLGPVTAADFRAHVTQTLFDWSAVKHVRSANEALHADRLRMDVARERAAIAAAAAYVRARRAAGRLAAQTADVALVEDLLSVSRDQLAAGLGVRLDVTRAEARLAALRSDLILARAESSRAGLALLHGVRPGVTAVPPARNGRTDAARRRCRHCSPPGAPHARRTHHASGRCPGLQPRVRAGDRTLPRIDSTRPAAPVVTGRSGCQDCG